MINIASANQRDNYSCLENGEATEIVHVEFVAEYAKELTYEKRFNILEQDQLYVFAKQHRKILRIKDQVDFIISDSPLLLSSVYSEINPNNLYDHEIFEKLVFNINDKYNTAREELVVEITQVIERVALMEGIVRSSEQQYYTLKDTLQDQKHDIQELNRLLNGGY